MHEKPYHSPSHVQEFGSDDGGIVPLPWKEFVTKWWLTKRSEQDLELIRTGRHVTYTNSCAGIERFGFQEVVPCLFDSSKPASAGDAGAGGSDGGVYIPESRMRGFWPIYELRRDGSGKPFENILELRTEKIVNFLLEIPLLYGGNNNLGGYVAVRYEDLVQNGTGYLLERISSMIGLDKLPDGCVASSDGHPEKYLSNRYIPSGFREWILEHVDRDVEKLLGYYTDG